MNTVVAHLRRGEVKRRQIITMLSRLASDRGRFDVPCSQRLVDYISERPLLLQAAVANDEAGRLLRAMKWVTLIEAWC